jgi:hypothetical protein
MIRKNESDLVAKIDAAGVAAMSTVVTLARMFHSAIISCRDGTVVKLNPDDVEPQRHCGIGVQADRD